MTKSTLIIILFSILSCNNRTNNNNNNNSTNNKEEEVVLIEKDTIFFSIKSDTNYFSWYTQVLEIDDTTYLFRLEYFKDIIEVYNFDSKKLIKEIMLKTEGPNSVRDLQAGTFHFFSKDSFLFANRHGEIFSMLNDSITEKYQIAKPEKYASIYGVNAMKMIINGENVFLRYVSFAKTFSDDFNKSSILIKYNPQTDMSHLCKLTLHKDYQENNFPVFFKNVYFTHNSKKNTIVASYSAFPELYEYSIDKDSVVKTYKVSSKRVPKLSVPTKKNISSEEQKHLFLTNSLYGEIIYDKYRDIYYRFIALKVPEFKKSIKRGYVHKPYAIMVLNANFEILTERVFPQFRFHVKDWFITKEGLWVSNNNPFNAIFDENKISFTLLTVEDNE